MPTITATPAQRKRSDERHARRDVSVEDGDGSMFVGVFALA